MTKLRGLSNLGVALNSKHLGQWTWKIGQYMLNFASLELISYQYLMRLEATRGDFNRNLDSLLAARIARVRKLVKNSALPETTKGEVDGLWAVVSDLSEWRNRIAHNPVTPVWKTGDPTKDPPDLIGVPDMKQLKKGNTTDAISLQGMNKLIDATAEIAQRLNALAQQI